MPSDRNVIAEQIEAFCELETGRELGSMHERDKAQHICAQRKDLPGNKRLRWTAH